MKKKRKDPQSVASKVVRTIYGHGSGWVFTPISFNAMGSRSAVANALSRLKHDGIIRQLAVGLYDYPKQDPEFGILSPSLDAIIAALQLRHGVRLQPAGGYAANILGLSTQVPMRIVFLTDGPSRELKIGNMVIILKRTTPRNMATVGRISGTVIQALRWLGKRHVDAEVVAKLQRVLDTKALDQLMKDIGYAPIWIADIIRQLNDRRKTGNE